MPRLKWWMRVVGAFYLLLTLMNFYGLFVNPQFFAGVLPPPLSTDPLAVRAFSDAWLAFIFELMVTGAFLLWASREPLKHLTLVWLVVWFEVFRGIADDVYLISRGYDASGYIGFIVVHIIIIVTGAMFARQASAQTSEQARSLGGEKATG